MSIVPDMKRLVIALSLLLAIPLGARADSPPMDGPGHDGDGPGHMHMMAGCGMPGGPEHGGMFGRGHMFGEDGPGPMMLHRLHLTEAQEDKVFAIMHAQAPQARELRKAIRKAHRGLHDLVTTGPYDDAKAKSLADSLGKAMSETALLHARTHHQILDVLTPDQRQELMKHLEHGHGEEHGPAHHDHPHMSSE